MPASAGSKRVREGDLLPRLTLTRAAGTFSIPSSGRHAALLVFVHPGPCPACDRYLTEIEGVVDDVRGWGTQLCGVVVDDEPRDDGAFPRMRDEGGAARRKLGLADDEACVLLADRWGEAMEVATYGSDHGFPLPRQLVESAKIVDISCGECNVPGKEWREADA